LGLHVNTVVEGGKSTRWRLPRMKIGLSNTKTRPSAVLFMGAVNAGVETAIFGNRSGKF